MYQYHCSTLKYIYLVTLKVREDKGHIFLFVSLFFMGYNAAVLLIKPFEIKLGNT